MIKVNYKNSHITQENINLLKEKTKIIQNNIFAKNNDFMGWVDNFLNLEQEVEKIQSIATKIKDQVNVLLNIGIGGSYMGAKAAIDSQIEEFDEQKTKVIFTGYNLSERQLKSLVNFLKDKKFAIYVVSKSGKTLETLVTFEFFKNILKKRYGTKFNEYIYATTDDVSGSLRKEVNENNYQCFSLPSSIGGRFSILTNVALLPMAVSNIDISKVINGAKKAYHDFKKTPNNEANTYACIRYLLGLKFNSELLVTYEPSQLNLLNWQQQLYAESEGKENKGIMPIVSLFSRDLHSIGQLIQDGKKTFFITSMHIVKNVSEIASFYEKKTFNDLNNIIFDSTIKAHFEKGKIDNIIFEIEKWDEQALGYYLYFHMFSCVINCLLLKINPFNQPGVEVYKKNIKLFL